MLTLNDGRAELWQWDTGRTLTVDADCSQVHFSNKVFGRSIDVDVIDGTAIIPDVLLQTDKDLNVWAFVGTAENGYTKISKTFKVNRRNKPADYVFTPQEQILLKDATAILEEAKNVANYAMETAKKAEASADKAAKIADEVKKLADQVGQNADTATKAKADALTAQAKAEEARNAAEAAKKAAEDAANNSGIDASAASAAATRAQNAATNAMNALSDTQALYHTMQEYASQSIQNVQTEGDTQVQRVADEGAAKTAAAKEQADRAQAEADRAEAARANAEDVVESCIPDDTAVDGKPWTSKKIVDSLCMPFEESGNPVQCYPVENYPLGVKVSWVPTQAGSGDPSQDNIRQISGRDSVKVERCGKNLVKRIHAPGYTVTKNGLTFTMNDDYSITVSGTATEVTFFNFEALKNAKLITNYTINAVGKTVVHNGFEIRDIVVQPVSREGRTRLYLYFKKDIVVDATYYPTIVYGSTATPYEPYTGSTTDIALPETVYGGTLDVESGVVTVDRGITIADGTTNKFNPGVTWGLPSRTSPGIVETYWDMLIISSHFKGSLFASNKTYEFIFTNLEKMTGLFSTADELNAYLVEQNAAGTPVTFVYKLANPYTIQLTPKQITALSGVNTIYTDADGVVVTGAEDPKHTITELKNAIISLGGNV